jgi:hypothetical protein
MHHRAYVSLILAALLATAGLLGGCSPKAAQAPAVVPLDNVQPAPLKQMSPAEKTSKIAPGFPIQVPVPEGELLRGEAQGGAAWDYVIVVPGDVNSVQRWYFEAYSGAEWTVLSRTASVMNLQKNRAESVLKFEAVAGSPAKTRVTASVGIGTSVQTQ